MKQLLLVLCTIAGAAAYSQERFAKTITQEDLKNHLQYIASAEMQGRETATEGQRKAAAYIEEQFKKLNLKPIANGTYQQPFPVFRDSLAKAVLNVNGSDLLYDSDFAVTNNSGFNMSLEVPEVLFAGFGISDTTRDDYASQNAQGKVVVVWGRSDYYGLQRAAKKNGAAALIIIQERFPKGATARKGRMYMRDFRQDSIPNTFVVSDSAANLIFGMATDSIRKAVKEKPPTAGVISVPVKLALEKNTEHLESTNVIGMLEGGDKKDEAIVITAHYDHLGIHDSAVYYGADDDGSGTVSVIEIAEAFVKAAEAGERPKRSVIFMAVSGEEKGLWGSDYYSDNPLFPLEKTSANLNIDMIGRIEKGRKGDSLNYIYVIGDNRLSSDLRTISESQNKKYLKLSFDYKYNDPNDPERIYYRSDHYNFARKGVPAIFYFSGLHDDYHRPTDTPDKIRYDLLTRRGQMIFYTAWEIADRNEMLKRDLPMP